MRGGGAGTPLPLSLLNVAGVFSETPRSWQPPQDILWKQSWPDEEPPLLTGREVKSGRPGDPETLSIAVMDSSICALELLGVLVSAGAWLCSLATTLMSTWLTLSTDLLPTEIYELGLWETCVVQDLGGLECRPYDSLLGLPPDIKLARILMCVTLGAGLLALLLAIPGIHLVNSCTGQLDDLRCKRGLKMAGGALCLVSGILGLIPVSYIAHLTVERFFDESLPDVVPRWEFGDALFCGWTAGFLHLVAGTLLLTSCLRLQRETCNVSVPIPLMGEQPGHPFIRTRSEYV
ncbi:putative claudin-24 [Toxotes jaculatrix]|uniref:putative claudin-24 n=1 Tax=Toxotes jaculatrix TaxID=941984 RepID=UPI001B3A81F9|nr:putative claudin-24 [Toxotes jaculatrix]